MARFDDAVLGELAHADAGRLAGRHAQRHLVLLERDDEELERHAGDLLLLDADDASDAVRRIDDPLVGLEAMPLIDGLLAGRGSRRGGGDLLAGAGCWRVSMAFCGAGLGGASAATAWPNCLGTVVGTLLPPMRGTACPAGATALAGIGLTPASRLGQRSACRGSRLGLRLSAPPAWPGPSGFFGGRLAGGDRLGCGRLGRASWHGHWPAAPCAGTALAEDGEGRQPPSAAHASSRQPSLPRFCCWSLRCHVARLTRPTGCKFRIASTPCVFTSNRRENAGLPVCRSSSSSISPAFRR